MTGPDIQFETETTSTTRIEPTLQPRHDLSAAASASSFVKPISAGSRPEDYYLKETLLRMHSQRFITTAQTLQLQLLPVQAGIMCLDEIRTTNSLREPHGVHTRLIDFRKEVFDFVTIIKW